MNNQEAVADYLFALRNKSSLKDLLKIDDKVHKLIFFFALLIKITLTFC